MARAFLLCAFVAVVFASVDIGNLPPGYVINYNTPKDSWDTSYVVVPIAGVTPQTDPSRYLDLRCALAINSILPDSEKPKDYIRIASLFPPTTSAITPFLSADGDNNIAISNVTNGFWFLSSESDCSGTVSTCKDSVEAEVSCYLQYQNASNLAWTTHYPYQLLNQRRTGKFQLTTPDWLYYWLAVTNDVLDANGQFNLYLGTQFYSNGGSSGIQMWVYKATDGWPSGTTGNPNVSSAYWPLAAQNGDWISQPLPLTVGIYYVGAIGTTSGTGEFTNKFGFNSPPTQAAHLNASLNRFGLLALVFLVITANAFKQF